VFPTDLKPLRPKFDDFAAVTVDQLLQSIEAFESACDSSTKAVCKTALSDGRVLVVDRISSRDTLLIELHCVSDAGNRCLVVCSPSNVQLILEAVPLSPGEEKGPAIWLRSPKE
jgi:hypothetical protein